MKKSCILFFLLYAFLYIFPLGFRPLTIPDETRYAEIPREMRVSGDWVSPRLNNLKYFEKPVLGYWVNAVSMLIFGENAFALRVPSALSVFLSGFMIFMLVRKFPPQGGAGVLAPVIFFTCPLVWVLGQINLLDSLLSMFLTGAMVCFFFAYMARGLRRKILFLAATGIFCGLAFLTKGFLAFAVPVLTVAPFLIWEGRFRDIFKIPWIPIMTAFLVALPWALMIHFREGDFWHYFFWTEHIARFLDPIRGQHPKSFGYFFPILVGGALPWVVQIPAAFSGVIQYEKRNSLIRFAACWFVFPFLFFSLSSGKLIPYILPCFPPLAVFIGVGLYRYLDTQKTRAFSVAAGFLAILTAAAGLFFIVSNLSTLETGNLYGPDESYKWLLGASAFFLWAIMAAWSTRIKDFRKRLVAYTVPVLIFFSMANLSVPKSVLDRRTPGKILTRNLASVTPNAILISNDNLLRAVCWYFKRTNVKILERSGELSYGLAHDDENQRKFLNFDALKEMIRQNRGKRPVMLILIKDHYDTYAKRLPDPVFVDTTKDFVLAVF